MSPVTSSDLPLLKLKRTRYYLFFDQVNIFSPPDAPSQKSLDFFRFYICAGPITTNYTSPDSLSLSVQCTLQGYPLKAFNRIGDPFMAESVKTSNKSDYLPILVQVRIEPVAAIRYVVAGWRDAGKVRT